MTTMMTINNFFQIIINPVKIVNIYESCHESHIIVNETLYGCWNAFLEFPTPSCKWGKVVLLQCESYKFGPLVSNTTCNLISHVCLFFINRPLFHQKNKINGLETMKKYFTSNLAVKLLQENIRVLPRRLKQNIAWQSGFQTTIFDFLVMKITLTFATKSHILSLTRDLLDRLFTSQTKASPHLQDGVVISERIFGRGDFLPTFYFEISEANDSLE